MLVTELTRNVLKSRKQARDLKQRGYEIITCKFGIGDLWQLDRGYRVHQRIVDAVVGEDGKSVFVKVERST